MRSPKFNELTTRRKIAPVGGAYLLVLSVSENEEEQRLVAQNLNGCPNFLALDIA